MTAPQRVRPAQGKLAVLLPGLGAVATTTIAGTLLARKGQGVPVGSLTQLGTLRTGGSRSPRVVPIKEALSLASLSDIAFGGWDIFEENALESARHAGVLSREHLDMVEDELAAIRPMKGAFYPEYVKKLSGTHTKTARSKADMVEQLRADIRAFIAKEGATRAVAVWCGSTEVYMRAQAVHETVASFEKGLLESSPHISAAQLYAWACLQEGVPFANGSPNLCVDFPAARLLAEEREVALAGKDFKTGQTLMKTVIAPALRTRMLGLNGWFSTNILGNRDGQVLDDPESFRAKEVSKLGVLESILPKDLHPELYGDYDHKVHIHYYPPRGDAKEGWDNIDIFGWLGYPMQIKVNFQCRDSILAAPIVLDLALLMDLAQRAGLRGTQEWLGFYFKSPMTQVDGASAVHDLFVQSMTLKNKLRFLAGDEPIARLGAETLD